MYNNIHGLFDSSIMSDVIKESEFGTLNRSNNLQFTTLRGKGKQVQRVQRD
jgi:hypothetical protein